MAEQGYTYDQEVTLVKFDPDSGKEVSRHTSYAEIVSVYGRETYAAMGVGLRPEFMAVLPSWHDDYHGEQRLEFEGVPYRVIRAYKTRELTAELTVTRLKPAVSDSDTGL